MQKEWNRNQIGDQEFYEEAEIMEIRDVKNSGKYNDKSINDIIEFKEVKNNVKYNNKNNKGRKKK